MARAYSDDLREKVLAAYTAGKERRASWPRGSTSATMTVEAATDREALWLSGPRFVPKLHPGHVVVMDNFSDPQDRWRERAHRSLRRPGALPAALFARPQTIEKAWSKLKAN